MDETVSAGDQRQTAPRQTDSAQHRDKRPANIKMDVPYLKKMPRFTTIGWPEKANVQDALAHPLSGYIGGSDKTGYWIRRLQAEWSERFNVKHAIACNSATSGLLAACMALGVGPGDTAWTSAYSMSASAACAKVLGAHIAFIDIEPMRFSINMNQFRGPTPKCIIVPSLFGHPAYLSAIRAWCDSNNVWMIEDAAQSPFAEENGKYAGTVGHLGVFSLNVHKHLQCGEGGVVTTSDPDLADAVVRAINHGELAGGAAGLNLRMTEPTAAIACAQLAKADGIIESRRELGLALTDMVKDIAWIDAPVEATACKHVYYVWAALVRNHKRSEFVKHLNEAGVPMREGYSDPLPHVFHQDDPCPTTWRVEDELMIFEVCAWSPNSLHLQRMKSIMQRAAEKIQ